MNHVTSIACCHLSGYILSDHRRKFSFCLCAQPVQFFGGGAKGKMRILSKSPFLPSPTGILGKTRPVLWKIILKHSHFQRFPHSVLESLKTKCILVVFLFASLRHALLCPPLALGSGVCLLGCRR